MIRIVFSLFFLFAPSVSVAQIIVNEIAWMGSPVQGVDSKQWWRYEWIELYNVSDTDISVTSWTIELQRENVDFVIPLQGVIKQKEYFVVGASPKIKNLDLSYGSLTGKFANSGQLVLLKDRTGNVVDQIDARSGWFAGDNETKLTMERRFPERDSADPENWGSSIDTGGSLKKENTVFRKESILNLDSQTEGLTIKKSPWWASSFEIFANTVFILAFLLALGSALLVLFLRRYLLSKDANSFDVLQD